ncbi:hypothetical protein [Sinorhizobium fredii]|uniref:hypothetical protein n=1 Tax=Rhizobium fredii TaxID=380 RepID=UPI003398F570
MTTSNAASRQRLRFERSMENTLSPFSLRSSAAGARRRLDRSPTESPEPTATDAPVSADLTPAPLRDIAEKQSGFRDHAFVECAGFVRIEIAEQHKQRLDSSPRGCPRDRGGAP